MTVTPIMMNVAQAVMEHADPNGEKTPLERGLEAGLAVGLAVGLAEARRDNLRWVADYLEGKANSLTETLTQERRAPSEPDLRSLIENDVAQYRAIAAHLREIAEEGA